MSHILLDAASTRLPPGKICFIQHLQLKGGTYFNEEKTPYNMKKKEKKTTTATATSPAGGKIHFIRHLGLKEKGAVQKIYA